LEGELSTLPTTPGIPGITSSGNPLGKAVHKKAIEDFEALTPKEQYDSLRATWRSIAMGIASRAKTFSASCSSKEFGKLAQLVAAGTASLDKAFPPKEQTQSAKLIVNLFSSLGQRAARIAIPEVPTIDVTPVPDKESNVPDTQV
jgi:hexokinase